MNCNLIEILGLDGHDAPFNTEVLHLGPQLPTAHGRMQERSRTEGPYRLGIQGSLWMLDILNLGTSVEHPHS